MYKKFRQWSSAGFFDNLIENKAEKNEFVVDEKMQPIKFLISSGNINDNQLALPLFQGITLKNKNVLADKAYSTFEVRQYLEKQGTKICIPDKSNAIVKHTFDKELYKKRNIIERFFCKLKNYRRIATRYDKLSVYFSTFICLMGYFSDFTVLILTFSTRSRGCCKLRQGVNFYDKKCTLIQKVFFNSRRQSKLMQFQKSIDIKSQKV